MPNGVPFVGVTRGGYIESVHAVAAAVATEDGGLLFALGDVETPVFLRSTAKPFIAAAIVASGAARRFGFDARELAVIAASHGGEPFHVDAVRSLLTKIGVDAEALRCGAHAPSYEPAARALFAAGEAPSALHNNCSGKHAGIMALALALGADVDGYLEPSHPAERYVLAFCARMIDQAVEALPLAIDGCGIPVFATSLRRGAMAFARLATSRAVGAADGAALRAVREAIAAEPDYVAGTGRFDSALARETGGAIVGKSGAEGVFGAGLVATGKGMALKVIDGALRAVPPAAMAILRRTRAFDLGVPAALETHEHPAVINVAGRAVGGLRALTETNVSSDAS